jgi:glycosyltransferase involved in cell wall biosynthesis
MDNKSFVLHTRVNRQMKVVIVYKKAKSASDPNIKNPYNAGGLATNALHSVAVLNELGVNTHLLQVGEFADITTYLNENMGVTHMIIEAIWITVTQLKELGEAFPETQVVVRAHSKMGFLQVEPDAITVMRKIIDLNKVLKNVHFGSNNIEFAEAIREAYGSCVYLPNLYDVAGAPVAKKKSDRLSIASFGASRLLKLHPSAALAALQIAKRLGRGLDFYINVDKTPGGESVRRSIKNLLQGEPNVTLIEVGWQDSETFKKTIASMDLVIQLSATETFCMVAADAIASGVPVVGSPSIQWLPEAYRADADHTTTVANAGVYALTKPKLAVRAESNALLDYLAHAEAVWLKFVGRKPRPWYRCS